MYKRVFLLLGLVSLLSACGFHLKGMGPKGHLAFQSVYIDNQGADGRVVQSLKAQLLARKVVVKEALAQAEVVIRLGATHYQSSNTRLSTTGNVASELLKMTQPFQAQIIATEEQIQQGLAMVYRDRNIDETALLAASRELKALQQNMAYELAGQVLDRVSRSYQKKLRLQNPDPIKGVQ